MAGPIHHVPQSFKAAVTCESTLAVTGATTLTGALTASGGQATGLTLTAAAESSDTIAVTVAGAAAATSYRATVILSATGLPDATKYTIAETGDGTEISTTAQASLLFATSAAGAAELTVTDVVGGSDTNVFLLVEPIAASGSTRYGFPTYAELTFDAS